MATILRCINDDGVKYDLDIIEDVPFKLEISAIESGNIGKVFGVSSQQLTLPPSRTNDEFFGNLYDVGATPATSFIKTVPCQVLQDGQEIFTGKLYLDSVVTDNKGDNLYNVVVVNETVDFNFLIKDMTFADLDFSSLNHTYTYGNITGSWDQTLEGGAIFYPLVNYGFDEENPLDTQIKGGGGNRTFTNENSPIRVDDFKPAIRLRECLDAIFDKVNYTYTSSFFAPGSEQDDIYMLSTKDNKKGISDVSPISQSFRAYEVFNQDFAAPTIRQQVVFTDENYDNAGNYDTTTSKFTAGENGTYQFEINLVFEILSYSAIADARFVDVYVYKNGSAIDLFNYDLTGVVQGQLNTVTQYYNLAATDEIEVRVSFTKSGVGAETFRVVGSTNTRFKLLQGPTSLLGGTVNISDVYGNISIPEFMQGLIEKFNLVIEPVDGQRNVLKIETFNDWVDEGQVKDWSDKVDYNYKWSIRHPLQGQPKNIKFTDVEDNIAITQYHKRTTGKIYGEYEYISESDLARGEKTIGSFFAPTPLKGIDGAPQTIMPALAEKDDSSQPLKRTAFSPRLVYYNGRQDVLGTVGKNDANQTVQNRYYFQDESGVVHEESDYGLAHHLQAVPAVFGETKDLHFGNNWSPGHYCYHQPQFNGVTKNTAFYNYWAFYINELYDVDSRLVTCNVFLEPHEIPNIQLNDKIFIDGHYYRINKINGANVTREDSVEIELIKTLPRKLRFPRRRIVDLDTPVDITVDDDDFNWSGKVGYVGFESNLPYTGSEIVAAAARDGFQVYGSEVVWDTQKPVQVKFTSQTNVGLNRIDESAEIINAKGDNNTVANNVQISNVEGSNNEIKAYSQFVNVRGEDHTIGQNVSNVTVTGQNHIIDDNVSFANIFGGTNAYIKGGVIGTGSFNAILNTDEGNILESTYSTLMGGFGGRIESSSFSTMIGETHYISSSDSTILISNTDGGGFGSQYTYTDFTQSVIMQVQKSLDGNDYPTEKVILGDTFFTEEISEDFYTFTGSVAGGLDLDSDTYSGIYSFLLTPTSTGTMTITLPPCTLPTDRGYRRKLKFTTQNRSGVTFKFTTSDSFYIVGDPTDYYFDTIGGSITFVAAEIAGNAVWVIEEETRPKENRDAYGSFYDTTDQAIIVASAAQPVTINSTFASNNIALSGSSTIQMEYAGTYSFIYTAKVENQDNAIHYADFWIKYNGTDYPNSTVRVAIPARKSATEFFTMPVTVQLLDTAVNNGDKIQLYWRGDSTLLSLNYETFGGVIPNQPSIRCQIHEV